MRRTILASTRSGKLQYPGCRLTLRHTRRAVRARGSGASHESIERFEQRLGGYSSNSPMNVRLRSTFCVAIVTSDQLGQSPANACRFERGLSGFTVGVLLSSLSVPNRIDGVPRYARRVAGSSNGRSLCP
jgi:hypothetical protein